MVALRQVVPDAPRKTILSFREFTGEGGDELRTLRECFEMFLRPTLNVRKNTLLAYAGAINHWERITSNPSVCDVDDDLCQRFVNRLADLTSHETAAKNWTHLRPIFKKIGPRGERNAGLGIIGIVPVVKTKKRRSATIKRILSLDELDRMWRACSCVKWPVDTRIPASLWWRTAIVVGSTYGMRTGDLINQREHHVGLRWESIHWEPSCPYPYVRETSDHGWIVFCPKKTEDEKPEPLYLPIVDVVARHLREISAYRRHNRDSLVLPAGENPNAIKRERERISKVAGIDPSFDFMDLRRTANFRWNMAHFGMGPSVLGHAARDVNSKHYAVDIGHVLRAASGLEHPKAFYEPLS